MVDNMLFWGGYIGRVEVGGDESDGLHGLGGNVGRLPRRMSAGIAGSVSGRLARKVSAEIAGSVGGSLARKMETAKRDKSVIICKLSKQSSS